MPNPGTRQGNCNLAAQRAHTHDGNRHCRKLRVGAREPLGGLIIEVERVVPLELGTPFEGTQYYYSGAGDNLDNFMTKSVTLPATGDLIKQHTGVGWTSANHTSELVEFCALGPGSHHFSPYLWNSEVHQHLLHAMEIA